MSRQMLQKAQSVPNLSDLDLAEIESFKALLHYFCGNFEKSCRHSLEAERLFEVAGEQRRLMTQLCDHAAAELSSGRVDMAIQDLRRAEVINQQYQDTICSWDISYTLGMAFFHSGSHTEALAGFNKLADRSKKYSEYGQLIAIQQIAALMLESEGRLEEAYIEALSCFDAARFVDEAYDRMRAYVIFTHVLLRMGKYKAAGEKIRDIIKLQKCFDWSVPSQIHGLSEIVLAEYAAAEGKWEECLLGFERGLSIISQGPYKYLHEGLVRRLFGELLVSRGEKLRGLEEYEKALRLFNKLGNKLQSKITEEKIMNVK